MIRGFLFKKLYCTTVHFKNWQFHVTPDSLLSSKCFSLISQFRGSTKFVLYKAKHSSSTKNKINNNSTNLHHLTASSLCDQSSYPLCLFGVWSCNLGVGLSVSDYSTPDGVPVKQANSSDVDLILCHFGGLIWKRILLSWRTSKVKSQRWPKHRTPLKSESPSAMLSAMSMCSTSSSYLIHSLVLPVSFCFNLHNKS